MNIRTLLIPATVAALVASSGAEVRPSMNIGVGTRAFSMANNYVALASDLSAVYWNPAGLAFLPVREFQIGLDGLRLSANSTIFNDKTDDSFMRLRLSQVGMLVSVPANRGGLTFAGAFLNPTIFDDIAAYTARYEDPDSPGDQIENTNDFGAHGGLRHWSLAFGTQVAKGFGVGLSASLVTGRQHREYIFESKVNGVTVPLVDGHMQSDGFYAGYDLRVGLMYNYLDKIRIGLRAAIPQVLMLRETQDTLSDDVLDSLLGDGSVLGGSTYEGTMYSSYTGALGLSATLPFMVVSAELRVRAPYGLVFVDDPGLSSSQANHACMEAGVGVEVPLVVIPMAARVGYSVGQVDNHAYVVKYSGMASPDWSDDGTVAESYRHLVTGGLGLIAGKCSIDLAYGHQMWSTSTDDVLKQDFAHDRLLLSVGFRW